MHLTTYLRLRHTAERTLAASYEAVAAGHRADADVYYTCRRFAADCAGQAAALEPVLGRYERVQEPEPERLYPPGLSSARLREDDDFLAFLDVRPIRAGHSLVIPKAEIPDLFDLPEPLLAGLLPFARPVARAIQQVTQATRIGIAVVGLEVPHAHVHLVPIDELYDLDFRRARPAEEEELAATAERIRAALAS